MFAINKQIVPYSRTYFFTKDIRTFNRRGFAYERNRMILWDGFYKNVASYAFVI